MLKQTENKIFTILHCKPYYWRSTVGRALDLWVEGLLVRDSTELLSQDYIIKNRTKQFYTKKFCLSKPMLQSK